MAGALGSLETERVLLRHRQVLNKLLPDVEIFVGNAAWVQRANGALRRSLGPRPLTDKEKELFQAVIAENYKKRLQEECAALDCNLPVELSTRGERGQTFRSLTIKGGHRPNEILSEGEQRAVALADFLTEVGLNPANAGIVLDDPVTSQDHQRKERIAARLVREAETRQVIVFTHDLVFLTMLAAAAEDSGTEMLTHWVERNGSGHPGQVSLDDCPATTPQYRTTNKARNTLRDAKAVAGSKRLELIQRGMGELRRTVEEIVPHYFLKQVVNRWSDRIIVTGLKNIDWNDDLVSEIVDTFEQLSAYIEPHSHTEERSGAPPEPKDLETMIARVDALIRRAKAKKESRRRATGQ
jgi:energy-coupling factor transporter ATP-binding protein EcfA2